MYRYILITSFLFFLIIVSCKVQTKSTELKYFPVDNLEGIVNQTGIQLDKSVSSDGSGSLKIVASRPLTITLYDINDVRIEDVQLIYEAKIKSEGLNGQAYLEIWCVFKDKGEFFSRGFDSAIAGTTEWKKASTVFLLNNNEIPDKIRLNFVVNGVGTVWIDDVHLSKL